MQMKMLLTAGAVAAAALAAPALPASAEENYVPLFTYRTGPFSGVPEGSIANSLMDRPALL